MTDHTAYLSIGSNLGDKKRNLNQAIGFFSDSKDIEILRISSFYKTQPQDYTDQDWFINAVLKIRTGLEPVDFLDFLKIAEKSIDRDGKKFRFGPRVIDLDIVYYDNLIFKSDFLEIPHPRMHKRSFVLKPLIEIECDLLHPVFKMTSEELLTKIEDKEAQKVILLGKEG